MSATACRGVRSSWASSGRLDTATHAVQQAAEHGDPATRADLNTVVARLEARNAELEVRLIKWMIGTVLAGAGVTIAALRLLF